MRVDELASVSVITLKKPELDLVSDMSDGYECRGYSSIRSCLRPRDPAAMSTHSMLRQPGPSIEVSQSAASSNSTRCLRVVRIISADQHTVVE